MIKLPKTKFIGIFDINTLIKPKNSLTVQALTSALYNNSKHVNLFTVELIKKYEGLPIKNVVNIVSKILLNKMSCQKLKFLRLILTILSSYFFFQF